MCVCVYMCVCAYTFVSAEPYTIHFGLQEREREHVCVLSDPIEYIFEKKKE